MAPDPADPAAEDHPSPCPFILGTYPASAISSSRDRRKALPLFFQNMRRYNRGGFATLEEHLLVDRESLDDAELENKNAFDPSTSAGLFVGVSSFEDERIHAVPFAVDDAVDLAHLFTLELGLVMPERTILLLAGEPKKAESIERLAQLVERGVRRRSARMPDIYRYLGELTRGTEARGLFVLSVATHGVSDQGGDFLVATDSLRERTLRTGVAVAEVFDEVARAGAGFRLVLLDACRERLSNETRGVAESAMTRSFADAIACAKGSVVLSGATLGGFAYDDMARQNGVFTAALLDGLRGEAPAGPEGWITVRTLADFVQERVAEWVRRNRPDDAAKSFGIGRRVEANADALPLAPHPEAMRERQRYHARRKVALARVRENLGGVLSGTHWDQVATLLEGPVSPEVERLLEEIEHLDDGERSQRSLRDLLRELSGTRKPMLPQAEEKIEEGRPVSTNPVAGRVEQWTIWSKPEEGWWKRNRVKSGVVVSIMLIGFSVSHLLLQEPKPVQPSGVGGNDRTGAELNLVALGIAMLSGGLSIVVFYLDRWLKRLAGNIELPRWFWSVFTMALSLINCSFVSIIGFMFGYVAHMGAALGLLVAYILVIGIFVIRYKQDDVPVFLAYAAFANYLSATIAAAIAFILDAIAIVRHMIRGDEANFAGSPFSLLSAVLCITLGILFSYLFLRSHWSNKDWWGKLG